MPLSHRVIPLGPLLVSFVIACGGGPATSTQPHESSTTTTAQPAKAAASTCQATRVVPCQCERGKGYRPCTNGALGECVCQRGDAREQPMLTESSTRDPSDTPANVSAAPGFAQRTPSGLAYVILKRGRASTRPGPTSTVTVHYAGWTTDGKLFDSSYNRGRPASFPLNRVIKGWTEGLQLMVAGDKFRFWMPAHMAYGHKPGRPMGTLVFDVELIRVH